MVAIPSLYSGTVMASACSSSLILPPSLHGSEIISLHASMVQNYSVNVPPGFYSNHGGVNVVDANFCNVTVHYTHTEKNDTVRVMVWLPTGSAWNGRLQTQGGAGWQAGLHYTGLMAMAAAIDEGYATSGTDAGLGDADSPASWALTSSGEVNWDLLTNLASTSLNDVAIISKAVIRSFYGQAARYSYFNGCSQGGRQGYMLAQQYPHAYDGIAAAAPAINWHRFVMNTQYPSFLMELLKEYPPACTVDSVTGSARAACDAKDGLLDGLILDPDKCSYRALRSVGREVVCPDAGGSRVVTPGTAAIVQKTWEGAKKTDGSFIWYGPSQDAVLTGSLTDAPVIPTSCNATTGACTRLPFSLTEHWIKYFIKQDPSWTIANITASEWDAIFEAGLQDHTSVLETNNPDLSAFHSRGGKLVTYHGTTDTQIPARGTRDYYDRVKARDANVADYYRLFLAPGVNHCFGGRGPWPDTAFDAMREWVEDDVAPETLLATTVGVAPEVQRPLCPYPKKQTYKGHGDPNLASSFVCV